MGIFALLKVIGKLHAAGYSLSLLWCLEDFCYDADCGLSLIVVLL